MNKMVLELPSDLAVALRIPPAEQQIRLRRELAVRLYQKGLLSFGKARELAQMNKWELTRFLGAEGVARQYDVEDLEQDLLTLESLN
jgi:predicted HTH domain antitoxin